MQENIGFILQAVLIIGIANTAYLSYCNIRGIPVLCLFFPQEWCDKVTQSKFSKTMGIPNPFLGLGMLLAIYGLTLAGGAGFVPFLPARMLIIFGFLFSLYFSYLQTFVIKAYCTWCVVSAFVFTALFIIQFYI